VELVPRLIATRNSTPHDELANVSNRRSHLSPPSTGHLPWVDRLKGIGILCVVAGHIYYENPFVEFFYLFHMPLFFVISGYLLRPQADLRAYVLRKARHLLVPYLCFLALLYPIDFYLKLTDGSPHTLKFFLRLLAAPVLGGKLLDETTNAFWFVTCLFLTQQLVNLLVVRLSKRLCLTLMAVSLALAYAIILMAPRFWLPWGLNVVLGAAPLFYIGYLARECKLRTPIWVPILLALLSVILFAANLLEVLDMKFANFGTPILTLLFALAWIELLSEISRRLTPIPWLCAALETLGAASMVIMYTHELLGLFCRSVQHLTNLTAYFICQVAVPYLIYLALRRTALTRKLFLGATA